MAGKVAKKGDKVKVEYEGKLEDGTVFDSSKAQGKLLEFVLGSGQVVKGFDKAIEGMKVGQEKSFTLEPSEAYGDPNPKLVQKVPRDKLPKEELKPGMMLAVGLPTGQQLPAIIKKVEKDVVTIDFNHPLAGKTLKFKVKLAEIVK